MGCPVTGLESASIRKCTEVWRNYVDRERRRSVSLDMVRRVVSRALVSRARVVRQTLSAMLRAAALLAVFAASVAAQSAPTTAENGFQANRDYLTLQPWEAIDTASGNVVLTFTDLELPGNNGRTLKFLRTFNNMIMAPEPQTQWRFSVSDVPMRVTTPNIPVGAQILNTVTGERNWTPAFYKADGSLLQTNFMNDPDTSTQSQLTATTRMVITPTLWRYDRISRVLFIPDGRVAQYDEQGWLTTIYDNFANNAIELQWAPDRSGLTVVQHLGEDQSRVVTIELNPTVGLPLTMTYEGKAWTYTYEEGFPGKLVEVQPPAVSASGGPGRPWRYAYENPTLFTNVARVTTPQGGVVEYTYDTKQFVFSPTHTDYVRTLVERRTNSGFASGTWTFDYRISGQGGTLAGMTAMLPGSSAAPSRRVEYSYVPVSDDAAVSGGWQMDGVIVYEGQSATPVEFEVRQYTGIRAVRPNRIWYSVEERLRRVTRANRIYETEYIFDLSDVQNFANFHRPSSIIERTAGGERRRTSIVYQHLLSPRYIVGLPTIEEVVVGADRAVRGWTYDSTTGFRTSETALGSVTTFTPDANGNVARITKGNGKWTAHTYSFGQLATTTSSEPGYAVTRGIRSDGLVSFESQAGRTTVYEYDELGRVRLTQPPGPTDPIQADYVDEAVGQSMTVRRGPSSVTTRIDGFGRAVSTSNSVGIQTRTTYDEEGRRVFVSLPFEGAPSNPPGTSFAYDAVGRVVRETNTGDGSSRIRTYGANDTVTVRDENNHETLLTYRTFGHPDDGVLAAVRDARGEQWTYEYNSLGALTRVLSPGSLERIWNYHPDTHRLLSETHPESGTVQYTRYDEAGVLKERRDANGVTFTYEHDGNDRVRQIAAAGQITTITYETGSDNRSSTTQGGIESRFYYDAAARLRARDDSIDGQVYTRRFEYDGRDNLVLLTYPSGRRVSYGYDGENRITSVTDVTANRPVADEFNYHPSGALRGYRAGNNLPTTITYLPDRYWVDTITVGQLSLDYAYDFVGNITGIVESNRPSYSQSFTYDELDRLATSSAPTFGPSTYSYDANGNRTGAAYDYEQGTMRLIRRDTFTMTYDGNGNMKTAGPSMSFNYTSDNMMSDATVNGVTTFYDYDVDQWRARKANTGSISHFLRGAKGELLTEITDAKTGQLSVRDHIYAGSRLLSLVTATVTGSICSATIAPTSAAPQPTGSAETVSVTTQAGCAWTAVSPVEWITITSGSAGTGNGAVTLTIAPNTATTTRSAVVSIAGRPFTVIQAGGASGDLGRDRLSDGEQILPNQYLTSSNGLYHLQLFPSAVVSLYGPTAEYRRTGVTAPAGAGSARMVSGRLVIYDANGAEVTSLGEAGHPGAYLVVQSDRNLVIYAPGGTPIWSWGTGCTYVPSPLNFWVAYTGDTRTVDVASDVDCQWTTTSTEPWVTIVSGGNSSGTGAAQIAVAANTSTSGRSHNVQIAGHTLLVEQAGAPGYVGSDRLLFGQRLYGEQFIRSPNGSFTLFLSWNGNLALDGPNSGIWNTGTTPGPSFAEMLPDGRLVIWPLAGGQAWQSPTAGNPGAYARVRDDGYLVIESATGTPIWLAGPAEPCTYELWNDRPVIGPEPSSGAINIAAPGHCAWTATSDVPWVVFTNASGYGNGTATYDLVPNPETSARLGTITIGNQTTVIRQGSVRLPSDTLLPGQELYAGQEVSTNEGFRLVYQHDGNLVLYNPNGGALWHTETHNQVPGFVVMWWDGRLLLYNAFAAIAGGPIGFQTPTGGNNNAYLVLHGDGNLVIYAEDQTTVLWQTFTGGN
jgi:YD repeat-containing protein